MVLESTMICFDNSDYQRNGDYFPTRLSVQKDGINLVCLTKIRSNPENNVGLMTYADNVEVLATLTSDVGRIFTKMHLIQPKGDVNLLTGVRIAHLVLKHRQGKNHKMRIVVFIGSPLKVESNDLVKLAKRLKKEKVNVDIVSFGDHNNNNEMLQTFITAINGKDGSGSHLVSVPRGSSLSDALLTSPIIQGEDGMGGTGLSSAGFEFGVDPNEDPELALALRVSMEEQRQRQEAERRRAENDGGNTGSTDNARKTGGAEKTSSEASINSANEQMIIPMDDSSSEEVMLQRALAMSTEQDDNLPDFVNMTEEEQIAFAMQMSMQDAEAGTAGTFTDINNEDSEPNCSAMDVDYNDIISESSYIQSVLDNLPGVDQVTAADEKEKPKKNNLDKNDKLNDDGKGGNK